MRPALQVPALYVAEVDRAAAAAADPHLLVRAPRAPALACGMSCPSLTCTLASSAACRRSG